MTDDGTTQISAAGSAPGSAATVQPASPAAEEYLDGVRAALADLPAPEVAEILDDVRAHLADLTDELGGEADVAALTARLGSPGAYAAELRAAAGYPAEPEKAVGSRHGLARLALAAPAAGALLFLLGIGAREISIVFIGLLIGAIGLPLVYRDGPRVPSVAGLPEVRWFAAARPAAGTAARTATDFIGSLQPAWWVLRAIAAAALVVAVFAGGEDLAVLLFGLLAVPVSIWVGHRTRRDRRLLWVVVPLNALAAIVVLWMLVEGVPGSSEPSQATYDVSVPGLWQDGDREIRDIRPVDAEGNPLTGVYLFDQDGLPVDTSGGECAGDDTGSGSNAAYPRGTWDYDARTGGCRHTPPAPLVVAVPTVPASGTAPTPVPTPVPTSAPGGAGPTPAPGGTAPEVPAPPVAPLPATPAAPPTG